jgi:hypothetical protein
MPKVHWPDLRTPPDTWSLAEARGVAINPIVTGIGRHPRTISDEDWVLSCERDIQEIGLGQFLTDLLLGHHVTAQERLHCRFDGGGIALMQKAAVPVVGIDDAPLVSIVEISMPRKTLEVPPVPGRCFCRSLHFHRTQSHD